MRLTGWLLLTMLCSGTLGAQTVGIHSHSGMCDASAAISLGTDRFVVGNDEDNVLRVYKRGQTGAPIFELNLERFLQVDQEKPETDMEGAARVGALIYWITSHGRNKEGKFRESRNRFFAIRVRNLGDEVLIEPEGQPYRTLLQDLLGHEPLKDFNLGAASQLAPKEEGALNIEGLCAGPDGSLWIAFRNPIPRGEALMVPILNALEVTQGRTARLGNPVLVPLRGYGIRGITWEKDHYWLVAGSHDGNGSSRLVRWRGPGHDPVFMNALSFGGLNPEAIVRFPDRANRLLLLSDDGNLRVAGERCKDVTDPRLKRFRSQWVEIGAGYVRPVDY